jgi:nicotinate-nucleotide pyrophosphorylase (carboxylating)
MLMSYNRILIERKIREFLEEDSSYMDLSSSTIPIDAVSSAKIISKSIGYISGLEELKILYDLLDVEIILKKKDGDPIKKGDIIAELNGNTRNILLGERVSLNLIAHMSAITSTTSKYISIINNSNKSVRIACTRKTTPGLRFFEKKATIIGGGDPHRFSLDDMILLKDTHLKFYNGNISKLLSEIKKIASFSKKIEIEVEKVEDSLEAARNGADIIMLDNFTLDMVKEAINLLKKNNFRDKVLIEVSGNITQDNILNYARLGPDIISTSEITQRPSEHIDLTLRL